MSENACLSIMGALALTGLVLMGFAYATLNGVLGFLCFATFIAAFLWAIVVAAFFRKNW